jgi:hypothetical protein
MFPTTTAASRWSALALLACAGAACAQCTPHWETAMGNPGIAGGYAAPVRLWNGQVYIGGSFSSAGNVGGTAYIARYDPASNAMSPVGSGISGGFTNAFLTCLLPYTPPSGGPERLVVGGFFDTAGGVPQTASLAMWNGTSWEALGTTWTGTTRGSIWSLAAWNGRLYVGGGVVNQQPGGGGYPIGGAPWAGFASYDSEGWHSHLASITGISPNITGLQVFNDGSGEALYAIGRFSSLNGVPGTAQIGRWDGNAWTSVGGGLAQTSQNFGLEGITVFDDGSGPALYVAGYAFIPPGGSPTNVAKWNGSAWTALGAQIGTGRLTSIAAFDDGSGSKLYVGGTAMPQINYIARWENSAWTPVGGGISGPAIPPSSFPSVFGLGVVNNSLWVAGNQTMVGTQAANGLAAWTGCAAACYPNCDNSTTAPILNVLDFNCFLNQFSAGATYANCDGSTVAPVLNVLDFNCFLNRFTAGCP